MSGSSINSLLKRARHLQGRSDDGLEKEWEGICSGAKDELIAMLEGQIARDDQDESPAQEAEALADFEENAAAFDAWLTESSNQTKREWMRLKRNGWKA